MFTKEDTKVLKGLAILMMLFHHLVTFAGRIPTGLEFVDLYPGETVIVDYLGIFGKLCVTLYMFLGGYGLYKQQENPGFRFENNIIRLYKAYWKVFIIFVPIGFLFFANQSVYCTEEIICNVFSDFSLPELLQNFMGTMASYNREWWFFFTYICTSFCGFLYIKNVKSRKGFWTELFFVILIMILNYRIWPGICATDAFSSLGGDMYFANLVKMQDVSASFFMGIVFAKYDGITKLRNMLKEYSLIPKTIICVVGIMLIIMVRKTVYGSYMDMFYLPCFIAFMLEILEDLTAVRNGLSFLGKYNTNMWLIHGFYCYYFGAVAKIVYLPRIRILSYIVLIILTLASAVLVDQFYRSLGRGIRTVKEKLVMRKEIEAEVEGETEEQDLKISADSIKEVAVTLQQDDKSNKEEGSAE